MFREQLAHLVNREGDLRRLRGGGQCSRRYLSYSGTTAPFGDRGINLKGANGLELLKDLRAQEIDVPTLVLSMHDESLYAERAMRAGAKGYITKHEASAKVMIAIRQVLAGEIYLEPKFMSRIVGKLMGMNINETPTNRQELADRELEVFELIGRGYTSRQIGTPNSALA